MGFAWQSPEERWERIATGLLWISGLFAAFTAFGIYSGDDWRGVVMTAAPGLLCLGLWYAARVRLDHLTSGTPTPIWVRLVGWTFGAGALAIVGWLIYGLSTGRLEYREAKTDKEREAEMLRNIKVDPEVFRRMNEVEVVRLPDGTVTTRRKQADGSDEAPTPPPSSP